MMLINRKLEIRYYETGPINGNSHNEWRVSYISYTAMGTIGLLNWEYSKMIEGKPQ